MSNEKIITEEERDKLMSAIEKAKSDSPVLAEMMSLMNDAYNDGIDDAVSIFEKYKDLPFDTLIRNILNLKQ